MSSKQLGGVLQHVSHFHALTCEMWLQAHGVRQLLCVQV
jgi:hypothetical protein